MVRLLALLLFVGACSSPDLELPSRLDEFMFLPESLDLHNNSCGVLATTQTNRSLDIVDKDLGITQSEWDATGFAIKFDPANGTYPSDVYAYYANKGFSVSVREVKSCMDYEDVRKDIVSGCEAHVMMFPMSWSAFFIGGHVESIIDIYVHKALTLAPDYADRSENCAMITNSWGRLGTITGFHSTQYVHNKFPYAAEDTAVFFATYCPAQVENTCPILEGAE